MAGTAEQISSRSFEDHALRILPALQAVAGGRSVPGPDAYREAVLVFVRERRFHLDLIEQALSGPDAAEASAASMVECFITAGDAYAAVETAAGAPQRAVAQ